MKFVLRERYECDWPVKVEVPGEPEPMDFAARFLVISEARAKAIVADLPVEEADAALMREVLIGWDGVVDDLGNPLPFSPEMRDRMTDLPFMRVALAHAYVACVQEGLEKNSSRRRIAG